MRIPKSYGVYSTKIAHVEFSLIAHEAYRLILLSDNFSCKAELLHSSIVQLQEGWCLTRFKDENVLNIASFTETEFNQLQSEFGINRYKNSFEAPFTNKYGSRKINFMTALSRWSKKNTTIAKRIKASPHMDVSIYDYLNQKT
tara:strand:+ start:12162 stop:12590 length:429 start_codon:yes stop_codon:yes gene_type:complete